MPEKLKPKPIHNQHAARSTEKDVEEEETSKSKLDLKSVLSTGRGRYCVILIRYVGTIPHLHTFTQG